MCDAAHTLHLREEKRRGACSEAAISLHMLRRAFCVSNQLAISWLGVTAQLLTFLINLWDKIFPPGDKKQFNLPRLGFIWDREVYLLSYPSKMAVSSYFWLALIWLSITTMKVNVGNPCIARGLWTTAPIIHGYWPYLLGLMGIIVQKNMEGQKFPVNGLPFIKRMLSAFLRWYRSIIGVIADVCKL